jgi:hypothetical protein
MRPHVREAGATIESIHFQDLHILKIDPPQRPTSFKGPIAYHRALTRQSNEPEIMTKGEAALGNHPQLRVYELGSNQRQITLQRLTQLHAGSPH